MKDCVFKSFKNLSNDYYFENYQKVQKNMLAIRQISLNNYWSTTYAAMIFKKGELESPGIHDCHSNYAKYESLVAATFAPYFSRMNTRCPKEGTQFLQVTMNCALDGYLR